MAASLLVVQNFSASMTFPLTTAAQLDQRLSNPLVVRLNRLIPDLEFRLVTSESEKSAVFDLRYRAYLDEKAILPNSSRLIEDAFDYLSNQLLFATYHCGRLVSSIRVSLWRQHMRALSTPAREAFAGKLESYLESDDLLIDPNRFVVDTQYTHSAMEFALATLMVPLFAGQLYECEIMTATTRREHCAFYERYTHQRVIVGPQDYPTLIKPLCLMVVRFKNEITEVCAKMPPWQIKSGKLLDCFPPDPTTRDQ